MNQNQINNFVFYRKKIYASINGTKGNLTKLSKSSFLSKEEKNKVNEVIDKMEELRLTYNKGRIDPQISYDEHLKKYKCKCGHLAVMLNGGYVCGTITAYPCQYINPKNNYGRLTFKQSKNINDYRPLLNSLTNDFGTAFCHTILVWCGLIDDPDINTQFWELYLIEFNGVVVGICGLYTISPHNKKEMWLGWLGLIPELRNQQLGNQILDFLYGIANLNGCEIIRTYVDKDLAPINFYLRAGFLYDGTVKQFLEKTDRKQIDGSEFESLDNIIIYKKLT